MRFLSLVFASQLRLSAIHSTKTTRNKEISFITPRNLLLMPLRNGV